jgi:hypothetical protein
LQLAKELDFGVSEYCIRSTLQQHEYQRYSA